MTRRGAANSLLITLTVWLTMPGPALAHGFQLDEDHLLQDLALNFGVPLLVLAIGALAGIGLSTWMSRHGAAVADEDPTVDEPAADTPSR